MIEAPVYFRWKNDPDAKWIEIGAKEIPYGLVRITEDECSNAGFAITEPCPSKGREIVYEKYEDIVGNINEGGNSK